ncbi:hypothetical protein B0H17DRAFT_1218462 [Mycena rosella]|uniref:Uncharacterized protein n=1 Tax=Mycena rosella TaxID=1033263 RepID=A0AAD7BQE7_MYCRO|nr:hypothetical protein B0H17DRAFT_1218462 [Mycena rosella]
MQTTAACSPARTPTRSSATPPVYSSLDAATHLDVQFQSRSDWTVERSCPLPGAACKPRGYMSQLRVVCYPHACKLSRLQPFSRAARDAAASPRSFTSPIPRLQSAPRPPVAASTRPHEALSPLFTHAAPSPRSCSRLVATQTPAPHLRRWTVPLLPLPSLSPPALDVRSEGLARRAPCATIRIGASFSVRAAAYVCVNASARRAPLSIRSIPAPSCPTPTSLAEPFSSNLPTPPCSALAASAPFPSPSLTKTSVLPSTSRRHTHLGSSSPRAHVNAPHAPFSPLCPPRSHPYRRRSKHDIHSAARIRLMSSRDVTIPAFLGRTRASSAMEQTPYVAAASPYADVSVITKAPRARLWLTVTPDSRPAHEHHYLMDVAQPLHQPAPLTRRWKGLHAAVLCVRLTTRPVGCSWAVCSQNDHPHSLAPRLPAHTPLERYHHIYHVRTALEATVLRTPLRRVLVGGVRAEPTLSPAGSPTSSVLRIIHPLATTAYSRRTRPSPGLSIRLSGPAASLPP